MNRDVYVDGYNIELITDVNIRKILHQNFPEAEVLKQNTSGADGSTASSLFYKAKPLPIKGDITARNLELLNTAWRELLRRTSGVNRTVGFYAENKWVEYTASLENLITEGEPMGGFVQFTLLFTAHNPIGQDGAFTPTSQGITSNATSRSVVVLGNYFALPRIYIRVNSLTAGTPGTITIATDGGSIQVSREWAATDELIIDSALKQVTVNGTQVPYGGKLPQLEVGTSNVIYYDSFSARNVSMTVYHKNRYL